MTRTTYCTEDGCDRIATGCLVSDGKPVAAGQCCTEHGERFIRRATAYDIHGGWEFRPDEEATT